MRLRKYDPSFGDDRECESCSHTYRRHFDTYDRMHPVGCKYCVCPVFLSICPKCNQYDCPSIQGCRITKPRNISKCDCRAIPAHAEEGEIEYCALHDVAGDMYEELQAIKLILSDGFPLEEADLERICFIVGKADGK